ncbi:MAG: BlaI/MecI/CopY family transcriptional regulator [Nannocystaceae bacterium]|nr:BlaI/MecI/CopY family transcriptional regulator [Nannocystaceae bacterium]
MGTEPRAAADALSRRERQIMDILFEAGRATAAEVLDALPDPPSYSAVRALLRVLEDKGHLTHESKGTRYVYRPTRDRRQASLAALKHVVKTFFEGSASQAAAALFESNQAQLGDTELDALTKLIDDAREEGR